VKVQRANRSSIIPPVTKAFRDNNEGYIIVIFAKT